MSKSAPAAAPTRRRLLCWLLGSMALAHAFEARAQSFGSSAEAWGQTYRPAGLLSFETRSLVYPWVRAETQVWGGVTPSPEGNGADVVVLAAELREPTGHATLRAGRFVLTTGAVRPVHVDGGHARVLADMGLGVEAFSGVPVVPRFAPRPFDWLVGGRLSQRLGRYGALGASYVEQRDRGREVNEELGADGVLYLPRTWVMSGRAAYSLIARGVSEGQVTASVGSVDQRLELFGTIRRANLILPATSLFSVLSNASNEQFGASVRKRVAPRLRIDALLAYRRHGDESAPRVKLGGQLWLDDEGKAALEGEATRDGVGGQEWTGVRGVFYRDLTEGLRLSSELELVTPDHPAGGGSVWPWGRLSARYALTPAWQISAGVEGSSTPQFRQIFQALMQVAFLGGAS